MPLNPAQSPLLPSSPPASRLASYISTVSEDGFEVDRFVAEGAHLLVAADLEQLRAGFPGLREKIGAIHLLWPRLGRQLEFLADFYQAQRLAPQPHIPEQAVDEVAFALLYAVSDADILPDDMPGVGYSDDAAVVAAVLERHAQTFFHHCMMEQIPWDDVRPESLRRS